MTEVTFFFFFLFFLVANSIATSDISCDSSSTLCTLSNSFVEAVVQLRGEAGPSVSSLRADFHGQGEYGENLLEGGFVLEVENSDGSLCGGSSLKDEVRVAYEASVDEDSHCAHLRLPKVTDNCESPVAEESWSITLCPDQRGLSLDISGRVEGDSSNVKAIRHSMYMKPSSVTGFYSRGVVQQISASAERNTFASADTLYRTYALGEVGSIDIVRFEGYNNNQSVRSDDVNGFTTLLLNNGQNAENAPSFRSGYQEVVYGVYDNSLDLWTSGWGGDSSNDDSHVSSTSWKSELFISVNNFNFPVSSLRDGKQSNMDNRGDGDLGAFMTGFFANAVGCLCTFDNAVKEGQRVGQIGTTILSDGSRGYDGTYNYFDPDNFFALSSILYSGDYYLQQEVRRVIERTGSFMKTESDPLPGQLPHHFNGIEPYYLALSGETQTGPNIFWVKTALQYAALAGDKAWLAEYMPTLRSAAKFVTDLIEPDTSLLNAPGSLMIDVFIRNNYTSDSNAMVVGFLRDFAAAERAVGNESTALELEQTATEVAKAMNENLWDDERYTGSGDHFITQLNVDQTFRDFVDYDANLIAVANGVASEDRARAIFDRIDNGRCSASAGAGPQFVSEIYYGEEETTGGNTGDSWCSMGRIAWFDSWGRKRFGTADDLKYFNDAVLSPIQQDLLANTWMHERYGCDGQQQENRTYYYFEYPALVSMLLKDIRYGVTQGVQSVTIDPFLSSTNDAPENFEYHTSTVDVMYSLSKVSISVPNSDPSSDFQYRVTGLLPSTSYDITFSNQCVAESESDRSMADVITTDGSGDSGTFFAPAGSYPCSLTLVAR